MKFLQQFRCCHSLGNINSLSMSPASNLTGTLADVATDLLLCGLTVQALQHGVAMCHVLLGQLACLSRKIGRNVNLCFVLIYHYFWFNQETNSEKRLDYVSGLIFSISNKPYLTMFFFIKILKAFGQLKVGQIFPTWLTNIVLFQHQAKTTETQSLTNHPQRSIIQVEVL